MPKPCIEVVHLHPRLAGRRRRPQEGAEMAREDLRPDLPGRLKAPEPWCLTARLASQSFALSSASFRLTFFPSPRHTLRVLPSLHGGLRTGASPGPARVRARPTSAQNWVQRSFCRVILAESATSAKSAWPLPIRIIRGGCFLFEIRHNFSEPCAGRKRVSL
jgi:hypothetical protein